MTEKRRAEKRPDWPRRIEDRVADRRANVADMLKPAAWAVKYQASPGDAWRLYALTTDKEAAQIQYDSLKEGPEWAPGWAPAALHAVRMTTLFEIGFADEGEGGA